MLSDIMLSDVSVITQRAYDERCYPECRHAECHFALILSDVITKRNHIKLFIAIFCDLVVVS